MKASCGIAPAHACYKSVAKNVNGREHPGHDVTNRVGSAKDAYCVFPSALNCFRYAQRSAISFSFLMPANAILVPGTLAAGAWMYSLNDASFQVMSAFLLASL